MNWWEQNGSSALFAAVAIVVAMAIAYYQRRSKRLDWKILFDAPLVANDVELGADSNLQVLWKGDSMAHPRLVGLRLMNIGRREIRSEDWSTPFTVTVRGATIRSALTDSWSKGVLEKVEELTIDGSSAKLKPLLLNSKDWVDIALIVDGHSEGGVNVRARVAGETRRISSLASKPELKGPFLAFAGFLAVSLALAIIKSVFYPRVHALKDVVANNVITGIQAAMFAAIGALLVFLYRCIARLRWIRRATARDLVDQDKKAD